MATFGETPLYVQMRAGDPAGAAFQTTFVVDTYVISLQTVDIGRAKIKAWLVFAFFGTFFSIYYVEMAFLSYFETVKK
jgi:hypothetical protein